MLLSVRKSNPAVDAALATTPNVKVVTLHDVFSPALARTQQELLTTAGRPDQVQLNMTVFLLRHDNALIEDLEANRQVSNRLFETVLRCKEVKVLMAEKKAIAAAVAAVAPAAEQGSENVPGITAAA